MIYLPRHARSATRGFTLVEMIITMAVMVLLAAAIFEVISGVLAGASTLQDNSNSRDQIVALEEFLKKNFADLAFDSTFQSYRRGTGDGLDQNGVMFNQGSVYLALDAKPQANGLYLLRLARYDAAAKSAGPQDLQANPGKIFLQNITSEDPSVEWRPLIQDVKAISWKFQTFGSTQWEKFWNNANSKPNLVEFTFLLGGDLHPTVMDFWLPKLESPNAAPTTP